MFLVTIQSLFALDPPGRRLGADVLAGEPVGWRRCFA